MSTPDLSTPVSQMVLGASNAGDLMTCNPMSIRPSMTISEVAAFLAGKGISAAPVIDEAGRPVGVVSSADILVHMGQAAANHSGPPGQAHATVHDVMTPGVFSVRPETPAAKVVEQMLGLKVRRLFVLDGDRVLIGVISAIDVLGKLRLTGLHGV